jgi:hypothetical protein
MARPKNAAEDAPLVNTVGRLNHAQTDAFNGKIGHRHFRD